MSYYHLFIGFSFSLALIVFALILTDKSVWKSWKDDCDYLISKHFGRNRTSNTNYTDSSNSMNKKTLNDMGGKKEHEMLGFEMRNHFYKDGKFKLH